LLLVVSPNILLSGFNYEWFFQAIEDQLYITIRFLIVKALQVTLILLLVHQKDDYVLYAGLLVGLNSLASFFYVVRLRNYIGFIPFGDLNIWRHLKPSFFYFVTSIAASIGSQLDVTMIGFICGDKEVGYYSTSMKLIRLVVSVTSSVNMVVAPRCENIVAEGKQNEFKNVVITSLKIVLGLSFPLLFGVLFCSADVIHIIAGNEFEPSINYLRLLSLLITVQVISGVLAGLVLYPHKKEKEYSLVVIIGAIVNFSTNFVLIPRFASMGAIFASLLSEICALGINLFLVSRILPLSDLWDRDYLKYMVASMLMYGGLSILPLGGLSITVRFLIEVFVGAGVYFVFLALFREKLIIKMVSSKLFKKAF
jgi:Membrane protein involved in the export of O-antigen and teichoic acid